MRTLFPPFLPEKSKKMAEIRLAAEGGFDLRVGDADKPPRSKGIHLSGVLRSIAIEGGYLKEDDEELDDLIESTWTEQAGEDGRLVRVASGAVLIDSSGRAKTHPMVGQ